MHGIKTVFASWLFDNIQNIEFDYIVISINSLEVRESIRDELLKTGVEKRKIVMDISFYDQVNYINDEALRGYYRPSFSWYGEDLIIKGLFRMMGIDAPTYLDIGCNQPYLGNNTALLYLTGSSGINIDASSECIEAMKIARRDDLNICAGVDISGGERTFYMLDEISALNSFSRDYIDNWFEQQHMTVSRNAMCRQIMCYTIDDIIEKYCNGVFPDLLDLDIEGLDADVIKHYPFDNRRPKVICVESHEEEMNQYLKCVGYQLYFSTPHNEIFVDQKFLKWI